MRPQRRRWSARCGLRGGCDARDGAIIFCDLVGKLDALTVECDKCGRRGRYNLHRLIERYDIDAKLFEREPEADCARKRSRNLYDPGGARCPDLSKVV